MLSHRRERIACSAGLALVLLAAPGRAADAAPDPDHQWGKWRGPRSNGVALHGDPPVEWSESKNVRWKAAIPGKGLSTPIVWGQRVFVTTSVPFGDAVEAEPEHDHGAHDNVSPTREHRFIVLAYDRRDGSIVWQRTLRSERPHEATHVTGSWASNSAVTDGEHLIVSFGSRGIFGLTLDGEPVWEADLGDMRIRHDHGEGSSPALHGNTLVVNWDHQGESFVIALDKRTGKQRWKVARNEITSWSTPLIVEHEGTTQVIVAATERVRAYDLKDGKLIWECAGLSRNVVASPVAAGGMVYVANSYDWRAMLAIRLDAAKGDITGTEAVAWKLDRLTPYVPSPLLVDGDLCFLRHNQGLMTCLDAKTGKPRFGPQRLEGVGNVFASPVAVADRIYVSDRNGATAVLERGEGKELALLALNRLDDSFSASPAVAGDSLFLRGESHLYCLAATRGDPRPEGASAPPGP